MKTLITIITVLILSLTINSKADTYEEEQILCNINNIAGDTWNSSPDYFYEFKAVKVVKGMAELSYTVNDIIILKNAKGLEYEKYIFRKKAVCNFAIDVQDNIDALSDETMEAISECVFNQSK